MAVSHLLSLHTRSESTDTSLHLILHPTYSSTSFRDAFLSRPKLDAGSSREGTGFGGSTCAVLPCSERFRPASHAFPDTIPRGRRVRTGCFDTGMVCSS